MRAARALTIILFCTLIAAVLILSQLSNTATCTVYGIIGRAVHLDLKVLRVDLVQISNNGHIVAGFVLGGLAQLLFKRRWVAPLTLAFFVALEIAQLFSMDRQGNLLDVARGFGGALCAWGLLALIGFTRKGK
jgi:hypothetical protein